MELKEKTAIITGSGRGIGRAIALEFSRQGANVVCCARREHEVKKTVGLIEQEGGKGLAVKADVSIKEDVDGLIEQAIKTYGQVDVLFNNAAAFNAIGGIWEVNPQTWWNDIIVNLRGPMLCCQTVLKHMMERDQGIIINMTGGGATKPLTGGSGYGCSKAALLRLTDTLAKELETAGSSVLVFAIGPGLVRTETTQRQTTTKEGIKWIPSTKEAFDKKTDRPPEDCAKKAVELIKHARPEFNGRIFEVDTDFEEIVRKAGEIKEKDLFVLRFKK